MSLFLDNEIMSILASMYSGKQVEESEQSRQKEKLEEALSKIGEVNEADDEEDDSESMSQMLVETYLKSRTRLVIELQKKDCIVKRGYYFIDDVIVMLDAYRDGGELMWLPSMMYLNGSLADMIEDIAIDCENEEFEGNFSEYCDEKNCLDLLAKKVPEGKYHQLLQEVNTDTLCLWMKGENSLNESKCFIYVIFKEKSAYYFRMEEDSFYYGTANRPTIVNIMGNWMLWQHRDLILKMQREAEEDGI